MIEGIVITPNFPRSGDVNHFVQAYVKGTPYLFFGEDGKPHSEIIEEAFNSINVNLQYDYTTTPPKIELRGQNYKVVGMGRSGIAEQFTSTRNKPLRKMIVEEVNNEYGINFNVGHFKRFNKNLTDQITVQVAKSKFGDLI